MSSVSPKELTLGIAHGRKLQGRVRMYSNSPLKKGFDCVDFHLVVEKGLSGTLFIEGWQNQARRLADVCEEGQIITNLTIKAMSDKAQWQCTNLEFYG